MAAMEKYTDSMVLYKLRHVTRESGKLPSNIDIDHNLSGKNYSLAPPDRGTTARENKRYYNKRMKEIYKYGRSDVNTAVQWVITAPKDLPAEQEKAFFTESYRYLNSLYGEKNCIQCVVHVDEGVKDHSGNHIAGAHHMHYTFIPAVQNKSYMKPNKKGNITKQNTFEEKVSNSQNSKDTSRNITEAREYIYQPEDFGNLGEDVVIYVNGKYIQAQKTNCFE